MIKMIKKDGELDMKPPKEQLKIGPSSAFGKLLRTFALTTATMLTVAPALATGQEYQVVSTIDLERSPATELHIDGGARRLYALRAGAVDIIHSDTGAKIGTLAVEGVPGGITLAPDLARGYVTSQSKGSLTIFDTATFAPIVTVATGSRPSDVTYEQSSRRIFVTDRTAGRIYALDAVSGRMIDEVKLEGALRDAAVDNRGHLFVANHRDNVLHVIDTVTLRNLGDIPVWPGVGPTAIVMDAKERRIYVANSNGRMIVIDPDSGQMVGYVPIGQGDSGMAAEFLPARFVRLFVPTADGTLTIVQNAKLTATVESTPLVGQTGTAVAVDPKTGRAFLANEAGILAIDQ